MPELPEVETTRLGIAPYVIDQIIVNVIVHNGKLRWPVPDSLNKKLSHQIIRKIDRRAKYLLVYTDNGCLILHLGMSGSLRIIKDNTPAEKHDHVEFVFGSGVILRMRDPRRFGSIHWTEEDPYKHKLLTHLGPEPFSKEFTGQYLYENSRRRIQAVKTYIMDSRIVVGVGNIYASEVLFESGIHPKYKAGKVSLRRYEKLATAIKSVLNKALNKGETTLRDFVNGEGQPGYFQNELQIYNRDRQACHQCGAAIKQIRLGQRSTFYCPGCQR